MPDPATYPMMPGWKGGNSTGRAAALAITESLGRRHRQVVEAFARFGAEGATCDQVSELLDLPVHLVRPRASELERKAELLLIGKRAGAYGHQVSVYSAFRSHPEGPAA